MKLNNYKLIKMITVISVISIIFMSISTLASDTPFLKFASYIIITPLIFIALMNLDIKKIAIIQIIYTIISVFYLESLFQLLKMNTPLEMMYISDIISLILLIKLMINREKIKIKDDIFLVIVGLIIIFGFISVIVNESRIIDFINSLRLYFRYIPLYVVFSHYEIEYKKLYKYIYIANVAIFALQVIMGVHQDFRNGIFGMLGAFAFVTFITIYLAYSLILYLNNKIGLSKFLVILATNSIILALAEHKAAIMITYVFIGVIILIKKGNLLKKTVILFLAVIALIGSMNLMAHYFPKFAVYTDLSNIIPYAVDHYLLGNSNSATYEMGRFEAMNYIVEIEHKNNMEKILGNGLGSSIPQERWFYTSSRQDHQNIIDFPLSQVFEEYGSSIGYHLSSFASIYIDGGYLAAIVCTFLIIFWLYKGIKLTKHGYSLEQNIFGAIGIFLVLWVVYACGYGSQLIFQNTGLILMILLGIIQKNYRRITSISS